VCQRTIVCGQRLRGVPGLPDCDSVEEWLSLEVSAQMRGNSWLVGDRLAYWEWFIQLVEAESFDSEPMTNGSIDIK
jgi:hypothetical protein